MIYQCLGGRRAYHVRLPPSRWLQIKTPQVGLTMASVRYDNAIGISTLAI